MFLKKSTTLQFIVDMGLWVINSSATVRQPTYLLYLVSVQDYHWTITIKSFADINAITDLPISPNPNLVKDNATHVTLKWSPPFLWPGQRIDYYNVSFINTTDGNISYYRVNTSYTSSLASLTTEIQQCTTTTLNIYITAINNNNMTALEVFNISYLICKWQVISTLS